MKPGPCSSITIVDALRLAARARDHRNDHRADGAADRPQDSRYGHHAAPLHVRSFDRARACSGLEVCIARDLSSRSRSHARPRDPRACGGDGHREDSQHGRHGELQCARNPGHAYECGWRGVSQYMRSWEYPLRTLDSYRCPINAANSGIVAEANDAQSAPPAG